jgi:tetratricopeptide (TPR) repeat protein
LGILLVAAVVIVYLLIDPTPNQSVTAPKVTSQPAPEMTSVASSPLFSPLSPLIGPITSPLSTESVEAEADGQLFAEAESYFNSGNYQKAVSTFDQILEIDPNNPIALTYRGNALTELRQYEDAIADYTRAIELAPSNYPQPYFNRGRIYRLLQEYDKAIADLEKSVELDSFDDINFSYRANGNIGLIYYELGEYPKALEAFDAAIAANNTPADTFFFRAETHTALEDYQAAIADYQAAITRFPRYDLAYQGLGYAYYKAGQLSLALTALNQAADISPNSPATYFYLGLVHLAKNDIDQAETEISRAVTLSGYLPLEEQNALYQKILTDLDSFAANDPASSDDVKNLLSLIPEQLQ